ncbi:MAG: endonuclease MutS2 [Proteobacteria bacterium]|nr:endonuclease MutS2 [Pseudomonadota bacterium]
MGTAARAISAKTRQDLEWGRIERAVADRRRGPTASALRLEFAQGFEATRIAQEETAEAMQLPAGGEPLPLDDLRDAKPHLQRLRRFGMLDGHALCDVLQALRGGRVLDQFLRERGARVPRLRAACSYDPALRELERELAFALESDGMLRDQASPALRDLRREVGNLRARIVGRLDELVRQHTALLQDSFHTVREGRYVVPVRRDAHDRLPGIVHATSSSGATVFIEPRSIVPQANRLKIAEGELRCEETRILAELSDRVREQVHSLGSVCEALAHADLRSASAVLGRDLQAHPPQLVADARMRLDAARSPLLLLEGGAVVAMDLAAETGRSLVISGPNAGGKTVALKTLGLSALMVRAGLPLPAGPNSVCGYFDSVLTDVGDEQSTLKNLSSFSAHIKNLSLIMEQADQSSLVLLDELAGSTDPQEGAALACAVVNRLCDVRAASAVTTHYEALKAMALKAERVRNASVGFDVAQMTPTFELLLDVPGASSALAVAARFGIPAQVIEDARRLLPEQSKQFDQLVRRLTEQTDLARRERSEAARHKGELEMMRVDLEQRLARVKAQSRAGLTAEAQRLMEELQAARRSIDQARSELRREARSAASVRQAGERLDAVARRVALGGDLDPGEIVHAAPDSERPAAAVQALQLGARVYVKRLRAQGRIVGLAAKGRAKVAIGSLQLWVDENEIK